MRPAQREALARGRATKRTRSRDGRIRPRQVGGLQGEASLAISARLRRFIDAYDDDQDVLGKVAIGQLLADLWDANSFLRPIWVTVRRLVNRINTADRKASGKAGKNGDALKEDLKTLESLDGLVPLMDQLGRWHKRTTDVALRLGELSVRLRLAGGGGKGYLEERYGDGARGGSEEGDGPPPDCPEAEVLEDDAPAPPAPGPAPADETPPREDAP